MNEKPKTSKLGQLVTRRTTRQSLPHYQPFSSSLYSQSSPPPLRFSNEQIQKAEDDFRFYLHEKRRLYLIQLIDSLTLGANSYLEDEKHRLESSYYGEFPPTIMKYLSRRISEESFQQFLQPEMNEQDSSQFFFSSSPSSPSPSYPSTSLSVEEFETKELTKFISQQIHFFIQNYLNYSKEYFQIYQKSSQEKLLNQLTSYIVEYENYWKTKIISDVQNYHNMKLYEHLNKLKYHQQEKVKGKGRKREWEREREREQREKEMEEEEIKIHNFLKFRELNSENILQHYKFSLPDTTSNISPASSLTKQRSSPTPTPPTPPPALPHDIDEYYHQAQRVRNKLHHRLTILLHEIQHHPHPHPSSNSFFTFPNNSSRSSEILDRLRGEYLEITSDFNSNNPISSPNRRNWKSSEEEREESYHILSTLRSMNLQAELLYNQQYSHHINLQIELNALKSQINLHSSGTTSSIDDSSGNNTIPPPPAPAFPMEERPTRSK